MLIRILEPSDIRLIRKVHELLMDPSTELMRVLEKETNHFLPYRIRAALTTIASRVSLPTTIATNRLTGPRKVRTNYRANYANSSIRRFRLGNWLCDAATWREFIIYACQIIELENEAVFKENASKLYGTNRKYFSSEKSDLRNPYPVGGLYVETHLAANNCVELVNILAQVFGYDEPEINPPLSESYKETISVLPSAMTA